MEIKEMNIYQKIQAISEEAEKIPKNGRNDFSKYDYVRAIDVVGAIKGLLLKYNVLLAISEEECIRTPKNIDGKNWHTTIKCQATFLNLDSENPNKDSHCVRYYSTAADTLDKDIFKAKTGGLKYLFTQQFLLITEDWIDPETNSKEDPITINEEQIINLREICEANGIEPEKYDSTLNSMARKICNVKSYDKIPMSKYDMASKRLDEGLKKHANSKK